MKSVHDIRTYRWTSYRGGSYDGTTRFCVVFTCDALRVLQESLNNQAWWADFASERTIKKNLGRFDPVLLGDNGGWATLPEHEDPERLLKILGDAAE